MGIEQREWGLVGGGGVGWSFHSINPPCSFLFLSFPFPCSCFFFQLDIANYCAAVIVHLFLPPCCQFSCSSFSLISQFLPRSLFISANSNLSSLSTTDLVGSRLRTHHESKFFSYFHIHLWSSMKPLALCSWTKPIIQDILPLI